MVNQNRHEAAFWSAIYQTTTSDDGPLDKMMGSEMGANTLVSSDTLQVIHTYIS
jgi:hypothetical protein